MTKTGQRGKPHWIRSGGAFCLFGMALMSGCRGASEADRAGTAGQMVMYGETTMIRGFDPAKAGDVASAVAISKIYEGLLQYAYLERPYRVEPCLAESLPEVSSDGLTYTFRIRRGIFFQDDPCFAETGGRGRELAAADFVYAIKRIADSKTGSTGYWAFNDRIEGLDEFHAASAGAAPTDYDRPVAGLQAADAQTFVIRLTRPYPQLLWILTMHYAFAVPREAVERYGRDFVNHPVGTGPYVLDRWNMNYRVEFVRSPKWRETGRVERYPSAGEAADRAAGLTADAGQPLPFIDRIVQFVVRDPSTQWLMFMTGQMESSGISRDNWDAVVTTEKGLTRELAERGIRMYSTPTLDTFYIGFNMEDPVVGRNKKLRQALCCAFNTHDWVRFYNNRVIRAVGPIPPGVAGSEEGPSPYGFDLEKARRLLAEAGYPEGKDAATGRRLQLTIELGSANDAEARQSVELFVSFMDQIGVVVQPSYNNWPTFLEKMERRQAQLFELGWVADYPDAENFLQLFYGPNCSPGPNHCNYSNPEFDRLYERVRVMPDSPGRTDVYRQMARIVIEDCPWLFLHHPLAYGLHHDWLGDYKPHDFPYGMVKYYRIDSEARAAWHRRYGPER